MSKLSFSEKSKILDSIEKYYKHIVNSELISQNPICSIRAYNIRGNKFAAIESCKMNYNLNYIRGNHNTYVEYKEGVIHFKIPSYVGEDNYPLVLGSEFIYLTYINVLEHIKDEPDSPERIVLDFTQSDLSNIIVADKMFLGVDRDTVVIMPEHDKTLNALTYKGTFLNSCISNINEVIHDIDFSYAVDAERMFSGCRSKTLDFSGIKFNNLKDCSDMFCRCLELEHVIFDEGALPKVNRGEYMFCACHKLQEFDMSAFKGSRGMSIGYMFSGCTELKSIKSKYGWGGILRDKGWYPEVFSGCENLVDMDIENYINNMYKLDYKSKIFKGCSKIRLSGLKLRTDRFNNLLYLIVDMLGEVSDLRGIRVTCDGHSNMLVDSVIDYIKDMKKSLCLEYEHILIIDECQYNACSNLDKDIDIIKCDGEYVESTLSKYRMFNGLGEHRSETGIKLIIVDTAWRD